MSGRDRSLSGSPISSRARARCATRVREKCMRNRQRDLLVRLISVSFSIPHDGGTALARAVKKTILFRMLSRYRVWAARNWAAPICFCCGDFCWCQTLSAVFGLQAKRRGPRYHKRRGGRVYRTLDRRQSSAIYLKQKPIFAHEPQPLVLSSWASIRLFKPTGKFRYSSADKNLDMDCPIT